MKLESSLLPLAVRDSEERLSKGGVYLLETGLQLFLWVGASVQQELLLNIFGTPSFSQIDGTMVSCARGGNAVIGNRLFLFESNEPKQNKLKKKKVITRSKKMT